ncbi:unnamed protein product [Rotaria sordida]|uniref:TIR domain-containing protein n=1 Tax=Rotaria sordida TaxID=392033 RepID=A0A815CSY7_9BILA|nr:unnamed protein product [Rotaria sordida]CAF1286961.1 unnamed protein product [Rotaria sordida]CAF3917294.1 unnamed protein product [Rotaria sordida]
MSSSSSSTLLPSNTEEDLASESVQSSASERHQEVEDVASSTNVNVQSNSSVINDSSNDNLLPANTFSPIEQPSDNDYQVSISVDDETNALLNQGHSTVNKILELKADETLSRSNPIDQAVLPTIINNISDNSATTDNGGTEPHNTLTTQSQTSAITEENSQKQFPNQKHIMISYNQATASDVCLKIYNDLKAKHYNVWFDKVNLHGSILDGMGEAVDNSYILLLCLNNGYSNSDYCIKEAKYATEKRISVIPCIMEEGFRPLGGLEANLSTQANINGMSPLTTITSSPFNDMNFYDRFNTIISEHILSIQTSHLRRDKLNENDFRKILYKLIQEFSPETLQSFQNNQSSVIDDEQQQENDNDHLIQHLLQCNERLAENIRIQQENYINTQQYLLDQNERLAAFIRFQQRQDQNNAHLLQRHFNQNDELISIVRAQQEQQQFSNQNKQLAQITRKQQEQERNYHISEQLLQRVDQLTQLLVNQQQQHSRDIEALHQLINRSFERNESLQTTIDQRLTPQDRQEHKEGRFYLNFDTLSKLVQTIILLWTLIILLRNT